MALVRVPDVGSAGLIRDGFPAELAPAAWTDATNARFRDGYAVKSPGYASALGTPSVAPYHVAYTPANATNFFTYLGLAKAYCTDGTTQTEITRAAGSYTGTATDKWVSTMLSGILVCTNGVDAPQYWVPSASNDLAALTGWPASTTCRSIRAFKQHLIALDVTKSSTRYPFLVKWSHPVDPGAITAAGDWDETDETLDAGENDLADTTGPVIDGAALGDVFVIWKSNSTYAMRYIGAPLIFDFQKITEQSGILAKNAWCETPLGLVVLTGGDVVLQTGDQAPRSIIDGRNRQWLFSNISADYYANSFVVHNEDKSEAWICFPSSAGSACDTAMVWNYAQDTWGVRALPSVLSAAVGYAGGSSPTWDSDAVAWDSETALWDAGAFNAALPSVVLASAANTKLYKADQTELADGSSQTTMFERTGLHFDAPDRVKLMRAVRPRIDGSSGEVVSVYVGSSMDVDADPVWQGPYTFTIGSTLKVDCLATGRYFGIRFSSTSNATWRIRSVDYDVEPMGAY
jgi:hypothetical protein